MLYVCAARFDVTKQGLVQSGVLSRAIPNKL